MPEQILMQTGCEACEDTGDGFALYRRNQKGEEEVHILNETAYEIYQLCQGKSRRAIMVHFSLNYGIGGRELSQVGCALDDMLNKGLITDKAPRG